MRTDNQEAYAKMTEANDRAKAKASAPEIREWVVRVRDTRKRVRALKRRQEAGGPGLGGKPEGYTFQLLLPVRHVPPR